MKKEKVIKVSTRIAELILALLLLYAAFTVFISAALYFSGSPFPYPATKIPGGRGQANVSTIFGTAPVTFPLLCWSKGNAYWITAQVFNLIALSFSSLPTVFSIFFFSFVKKRFYLVTNYITCIIIIFVGSIIVHQVVLARSFTKWDKPLQIRLLEPICF